MMTYENDGILALKIIDNLAANCSDLPVGQAAARISKVFKSSLFNALLDIQNYYELNLHKTNRVDNLSELDIFDVIVIRVASSLGFSVTGGIDSPVSPSDIRIYISKIIPGGAADINGKLYPGDAILKINDIDCQAVTHGSCVDILHKAGDKVLLRIGRSKKSDDKQTQLPPFPGINHASSSTSTLSNDLSETIDIRLLKNENGLGFSIAGNDNPDEDEGIYVTKIIDGGVAHSSGKLNAGDRLVMVNGQALQGLNHEQIAMKLMQSDSIVDLRISRNKTCRSSLISSELHRVENSTTTVDSECCETIKDNILNCSDDWDYGIPEVSVAYSAINTGCRVYDAKFDDASEKRTVLLKRGKNGFGFNIVGGEKGDNPGIYISFILAGGSADLSKKIYRGDRILKVDTVFIENSTHEHAAKQLKEAGDHVTLIVQQQKHNFTKFEERIHQSREKMLSSSIIGPIQIISKKELFVRALFDYTAHRDHGLPSRGLSFRFGDILHVTNASDVEWWQASTINGKESGCIPSKIRVERKEKLRMKQVKFTARATNSNTNISNERSSRLRLSSKFPFMKSKDNITKEETSEIVETDFEMSDDWVLSYEAVHLVVIKEPRPVLIFGPLKDKLSHELLKSDKNKFQHSVPHTTRSIRENEVDGREYHFVTKDEIKVDIENEHFIEVGQYSDNFYGTSINAVRKVASENKHCILDVSAAALRRLKLANLPPIAIYIKPRCTESLMTNNLRLTESGAEDIMKECQQLEAEHAEQLTAVIQFEDGQESIGKQINEIIDINSGHEHWLSTGENI